MIETATATSPLRRIEKAVGLLNRIPYSVVALVARAATFSVFFRSGLVKISDWNATLMLFENEYHVPVLPPQIAAVIATCNELGVSSLVLLGLFTRLSTLVLLGMVCVIQLFVYPMAWPDHIQWLAFMLILVCRGPGLISLDTLIKRALKVRIEPPSPI